VTRTNAFSTTTPRLALSVLALLIAGCAERKTPPASGSDQQTTPGAPAVIDNAAPVQTPAIPSDQFKFLGDAAAPVRVVEFTDLQCPYCARFARETFPLLRERYIDTGKLRFESVDLPLSMHPFAIPAAIAARCAGEQGRYWDYREKVFEEQNLLGQRPFTQFAGALGLDIARFELCRLQDSRLAEIRADAERAHALDISSTPTFLIGRMADGKFESETVSGAQPPEVFVTRIERLLAQ